MNAFHDVEVQLLLWNGMVKIDAALKRWVPSIINKDHWGDVPKLKEIDLNNALTLMKTGKRVKIWGTLHNMLHVNPEKRFVDRISVLL